MRIGVLNVCILLRKLLIYITNNLEKAQNIATKFSNTDLRTYKFSFSWRRKNYQVLLMYYVIILIMIRHAVTTFS